MIHGLITACYFLFMISTYFRTVIVTEMIDNAGKRYFKFFEERFENIRSTMRRIMKISVLGLIFICVDQAFIKLDQTSFVVFEIYTVAFVAAMYAVFINDYLILKFKLKRQVRKDKILYGN